MEASTSTERYLGVPMRLKVAIPAVIAFFALGVGTAGAEQPRHADAVRAVKEEIGSRWLLLETVPRSVRSRGASASVSCDRVTKGRFLCSWTASNDLREQAAEGFAVVAPRPHGARGADLRRGLHRPRSHCPASDAQLVKPAQTRFASSTSIRIWAIRSSTPAKRFSPRRRSTKATLQLGSVEVFLAVDQVGLDQHPAAGLEGRPHADVDRGGDAVGEGRVDPVAGDHEAVVGDDVGGREAELAADAGRPRPRSPRP